MIGKTVLPRAEQGLGDTIQFIQYGRLVAERTGRDRVDAAAVRARLASDARARGHAVVPDHAPLQAEIPRRPAKRFHRCWPRVGSASLRTIGTIQDCILVFQGPMYSFYHAGYGEAAGTDPWRGHGKRPADAVLGSFRGIECFRLATAAFHAIIGPTGVRGRHPGTQGGYRNDAYFARRRPHAGARKPA